MSCTGNVEEKFQACFQKFDLYLVASERLSKTGNVKCALFLHAAGEKAIEVYNAMSFTDAGKGSYSALIRKVSKFVLGEKKDLDHVRYMFNRNQKGGETFLSFITDIF